MSNDSSSLKNKIISYFDENVCENMRRFILGNANAKRARESSYVMYIKNMLMLTFIFAHGCLKTDIDGDQISKEATAQSSMRIINSLTKAYSQYPVTAELIQFVLTDIQFEMLRGDESELYEVFRHISHFPSEFNLIRYFKLIAEWRAEGSARFDYNDNVSKMLLDMLENLEFLKKYDLVAEDDFSFSFVSKSEPDEPFGYIPVPYHLYYNEDEYLEMFSLFSVEKMLADPKGVKLRYICEKSSQTISFTATKESNYNGDNVIDHHPQIVFADVSLEAWENEEELSKKNSNLITQVHAINYKYIKNLALSISDALDINVDAKKVIFNEYYKGGEDNIFGNIDKNADVKRIALDWDSIIVMLLIEYSPTHVLETLFLNSEQTFLTVTRNLCKRIENPDMYIYGLSKHGLSKAVEKIIKEKLIFGEAGGFGRIPDVNNPRIQARARAMLIIASLSAAHEEETVERSICAGNIYDNLSLLTKLKDDMSDEQCCKYVCIIMGETFRHIICFYKGLLAYGEEKADYDTKSRRTCLPENVIKDEHKKLRDCFMKAAKSEADELKRYNSSDYADMLKLMEHFVELCEICGTSSRSDAELRNCLYAAIGKYEILNTRELKNCIDKFMSQLSEIDGSNVEKWIEFARNILEYLRNGTFHTSEDNPSKAIYPYTATCSSENENYDGYKTVTLVLQFDETGDAKPETVEIKVLSEFSYSLSRVFYCLPNILRTGNTWWIDPVLISFEDFNEIFVD